jgi:hypothetical protein
VPRSTSLHHRVLLLRLPLALPCPDCSIREGLVAVQGEGQVTDGWSEEVKLARELPYERVADLALLAVELDEKGRAAVMEMLDYVHRAQEK